MKRRIHESIYDDALIYNDQVANHKYDRDIGSPHRLSRDVVQDILHVEGFPEEALHDEEFMDKAMRLSKDKLSRIAMQASKEDLTTLSTDEIFDEAGIHYSDFQDSSNDDEDDLDAWVEDEDEEEEDCPEAGPENSIITQTSPKDFNGKITAATTFLSGIVSSNNNDADFAMMIKFGSDGKFKCCCPCKVTDIDPETNEASVAFLTPEEIQKNILEQNLSYSTSDEDYKIPISGSGIRKGSTIIVHPSQGGKGTIYKFTDDSCSEIVQYPAKGASASLVTMVEEAITAYATVDDIKAGDGALEKLTAYLSSLDLKPGTEDAAPAIVASWKDSILSCAAALRSQLPKIYSSAGIDLPDIAEYIPLRDGMVIPADYNKFMNNLFKKMDNAINYLSRDSINPCDIYFVHKSIAGQLCNSLISWAPVKLRKSERDANNPNKIYKDHIINTEALDAVIRALESSAPVVARALDQELRPLVGLQFDSETEKFVAVHNALMHSGALIGVSLKKTSDAKVTYSGKLQTNSAFFTKIGDVDLVAFHYNGTKSDENTVKGWQFVHSTDTSLSAYIYITVDPKHLHLVDAKNRDDKGNVVVDICMRDSTGNGTAIAEMGYAGASARMGKMTQYINNYSKLLEAVEPSYEKTIPPSIGKAVTPGDRLMNEFLALASKASNPLLVMTKLAAAGFHYQIVQDSENKKEEFQASLAKFNSRVVEYFKVS